MPEPNLPAGQEPPRQPEGLGLEDLRAIDQMLRPYFEGHWSNELQKTRLEIEYDLKVIEGELKFRKWMMIGIFISVFAIVGLSFYLFSTGRDSMAMEIIVGIVLVVMTFIAGYGAKSSNAGEKSGE